MNRNNLGCVGLIGLVGSLITILVFFTGRANLGAFTVSGPASASPSSLDNDASGSWEEGLPPIPFDIQGDVPVIDLGQQRVPGQDPTCSYEQNKTVAVIAANQTRFR